MNFGMIDYEGKTECEKIDLSELGCRLDTALHNSFLKIALCEK